jgi:hypothetical protein
MRNVRLLDHAEANWPQLTRVKVTYRGAFGYVTRTNGTTPHSPHPSAQDAWSRKPACRRAWGHRHATGATSDL